MATVAVNLGERSYDIEVVHEQAAQIGSFVRARCQGNQVLVVTDRNVSSHATSLHASLTASGFHVTTEILGSGEEQKSLQMASHLYDVLARMKADRKALVIALGGGVIGDLAGFVAATWNRGVSLLMIPTTLLAMVDSSVGGKVGINHPQGKNLIGAFHQPVGVWIDTVYLQTLPPREFQSGLAEVVKYGVILDEDFFDYIEARADEILARDPEVIEHIVSHSCRLKAQVVQEDERETKGLRVVLNYGHTFAHAFETIAGYGTWLHGEAVSAGMVCAARQAERRGLISQDLVERQSRLLTKLGLPITIPDWSVAEMIEVMRRDKKNIEGRIRLILPTRLGNVELFDDVSEQEVQSILETA